MVKFGYFSMENLIFVFLNIFIMISGKNFGKGRMKKFAWEGILVLRSLSERFLFGSFKIEENGLYNFGILAEPIPKSQQFQVQGFSVGPIGHENVILL